jgi:hypothetical protein
VINPGESGELSVTIVSVRTIGASKRTSGSAQR